MRPEARRQPISGEQIDDDRLIEYLIWRVQVAAAAGLMTDRTLKWPQRDTLVPGNGPESETSRCIVFLFLSNDFYVLVSFRL